jgi:hypothetical protein
MLLKSNFNANDNLLYMGDGAQKPSTTNDNLNSRFEE